MQKAIIIGGSISTPIRKELSNNDIILFEEKSEQNVLDNQKVFEIVNHNSNFENSFVIYVDKNKFNYKKHEETCLKNRRKRKSKNKRKR